MVRNEKLIIGVAVIAVIVVAGYTIISSGGLGSQLAELPEYKLLRINKEVTAIYDEEFNLWDKWSNGEISATEFSSRSQISVAKLNGYIEQVDPEKVPEEWKKAYDYYKSYILLLSDAFEKTHQFAIAKERGNLTAAEEYATQQEISFILQRAFETLDVSMQAWPVPPQSLMPPSLRRFR